MATLSGVNGTVKVGSNAILGIRNWKLTTAAKLGDYVSNETGGYTARSVGAKDGNGSFTVNIDQSRYLPYDEGDTVTLVLQIDAAGTSKITVPAIIEQIEFECDLDKPDPLVAVCTFKATAAWTYAGYFVASGV